MSYVEEDLQWGEPDPDLDALAKAVIGAAIEVHRELGAGLDEALYEAAMAKELEIRGIPFVKQAIVQVAYKGNVIGENGSILLSINAWSWNLKQLANWLRFIKHR